MPVFDNRVTLSSTLKDAHGMPQARIEYKWHENDMAVDRRARETLTSIMKAAGASRVDINPHGTGSPDIRDQSMGAGPRTA